MMVGATVHNRISGIVGACVFVFWVLLMIAWRLIAVWKNPDHNIKRDADAFIANRQWRRQHPRRAKAGRIVFHYLIWLPSGCALFVLFFLPIAWRITWARASLIPHYRLSVPINWIVEEASDGKYSVANAYFSDRGAARYGLTPKWFRGSTPSNAIFVSMTPAEAYSWPLPEEERWADSAKKIDFAIGSVPVHCVEYRRKWSLWGVSTGEANQQFYKVGCWTEPNDRTFNFTAGFSGGEEDLASFYQVLRGARPTD